jgi:adenylate cyclase
MVYEHVREQVEASFVDLGERELKNIARPVRLSCGHRPPRDSKFGCNKARIGGRNPRQALDCGLALSKHEWRPRAGLISPTHLRGHITALSKLSQLFVIARNSSFSFKGKNVQVQEIGKTLGVRYVL